MFELNAYRLLDVKNAKELGEMTFSEYQIRLKAFRLRRLDKEYDMHVQAWINQSVQATKTQGKKEVPVFKRFKDFFDYEAKENEILGIKSTKKQYVNDTRSQFSRKGGN